MSHNERIIAVASTNPVKMAAAQAGFQRMFPHLRFRVVSVAVASDVASQPMTDEETLTGALNRVNNAVTAQPDADFWIGIEGGVQAHADELGAFAWVVVRARTGLGKARSGTFFLPPVVADLVAGGMELGHADDLVFKQSNTKQTAGAIGLLTDNAVDRRQLYEQAVVLALVRFKNEALYLPAAPGP
ncbi:inosine/xanthosine triphosphatase [Hymenobacter saemangeumensis]|uniref:Probable inosine/xanthosine triphosphatase n=1 Tax=Hymenobacter saemangeumensis TaxID=1084522 RepID=A0ABP8IRV6_9BACT